MADKVFAVVRVGRDSADTYAAPMLGKAIELAQPDPDDYVEHGVVVASDAGAARLMKPSKGWRRLVQKGDDWFNVGEGDELPSPAGKKSWDNKDYTHYVVSRDNQIESGWEFAEDARDQLKELAAGNEYRVLTRAGLGRLGVDPRDGSCWETGPRQNPPRRFGRERSPGVLGDFCGVLEDALAKTKDYIQATVILSSARGQQLVVWDDSGNRFKFGISDVGVTMLSSPQSSARWVKIVEDAYFKFNEEG